MAEKQGQSWQDPEAADIAPRNRRTAAHRVTSVSSG